MSTPVDKTPDALSNGKDKVISDLKSLVTDGDALLKEVGAVGQEEWAAVRSRVNGSLGHARMRLHRARETLTERAHAAADVSHHYVADHPWRVVGGVALLGLIIGAMLRR